MAFSQVDVEYIDKQAYPAYDFEQVIMDSLCSTMIKNSADIEFVVKMHMKVDTSGRICEVHIDSGLSEDFNEIFIRKNILKMPKWEPAEIKGKKVESIVYLTIRFSL